MLLFECIPWRLSWGTVQSLLSVTWTWTSQLESTQVTQSNNNHTDNVAPFILDTSLIGNVARDAQKDDEVVLGRVFLRV